MCSLRNVVGSRAAGVCWVSPKNRAACSSPSWQLVLDLAAGHHASLDAEPIHRLPAPWMQPGRRRGRQILSLRPRGPTRPGGCQAALGRSFSGTLPRYTSRQLTAAMAESGPASGSLPRPPKAAPCSRSDAPFLLRHPSPGLFFPSAPRHHIRPICTSSIHSLWPPVLSPARRMRPSHGPGQAHWLYLLHCAVIHPGPQCAEFSAYPGPARLQPFATPSSFPRPYRFRSGPRANMQS